MLNYYQGQIRGSTGEIVELELITANGQVCGPYGRGGKYNSIKNHNFGQHDILTQKYRLYEEML